MVARGTASGVFANLTRPRSTARAEVRFAASAPDDSVSVADSIELSEYRIRAIVREELASTQAEIAELRATLQDALTRLGEMTKPSAKPSPPPLFAPNAPAMEFAKALCAEIFPGPYTIEVGSAPDDPSAQWYVFLVRCSADIQKSIDLELEFGRRLAHAFPDEAGDIRLVVSLP